MRLPLLPPDTNKYDQLRGHDYTKRFYRTAALLQVECSIQKLYEYEVYFFLTIQNLLKRD